MTAVLLDTCAAIWLGNGAPLKPAAIAAVEQAALGDGVFVSVVSAWEIGLLARPRGRRDAMAFLPDPLTWWRDLVALPGMREAELTAAIALGASALPGDLHPDPMDRLLVATAREKDVPIVTRDEAILRYGRAGHLRVIGC